MQTVWEHAFSGDGNCYLFHGLHQSCCCSKDNFQGFYISYMMPWLQKNIMALPDSLPHPPPLLRRNIDICEVYGCKGFKTENWIFEAYSKKPLKNHWRTHIENFIYKSMSLPYTIIPYCRTILSDFCSASFSER